MVKIKERKHEGRCTKITTPSQFGSHKSMMIKELDNGKCLCKDDIHEYVTYINRLDNGLADPCRYSFFKLEESKTDPEKTPDPII